MTTMEVLVKAVRHEARGIVSFEFWPLPGAQLPSFTAGSHVDVHLPNGLVRSYSLANAPSERHRYVICVGRNANSRGGSVYMHDALRVGSTLQISAPRNNFTLNETADHTVFIAGGIGITPIRSMIARLDELGRSWELFYCTRDRASTAYLDELQQLGQRVHTQLHFNFDQEQDGQLLDLTKVAREARPGSHLYCCGPLPMLKAFESATAGMPGGHVHVEYFSPADTPAVTGRFEIELARTQRVLMVEPGRTILDTLLDAGMDIPYSCMEGTCASCETAVLSGEPDHRCAVLSKEERASNDRMMICCSGSKSPRLVLDL